MTSSVSFLNERSREQAAELYFRHSLVSDYMLCPAQAAYKHLIDVIDKPPVWFSSLMGSATHDLIDQMHKEQDFKMSIKSIMERLGSSFKKVLDEEDSIPHVSTKYKSVKEQFSALLPEYAGMVMSYQMDSRNSSFSVILGEQYFVLEVEHDLEDYLFTGQIDQFGVDSRSRWGLRDIKIRDMSFYPSYHGMILDKQTAIYSKAVAEGVPACVKCKPRYETDFETGKFVTYYSGMCDACKKVYDTVWPKRMPDFCSKVWLRCYEKRKKNEYPEFTGKSDKTKPRILNSKNNLVYQKQKHPKHEEGYKKGDMVGEPMVEVSRSSIMNDIIFEDVMAACVSIRNGVFYRRPGPHCYSTCQFRKTCSSGLQASSEKELSKFIRGFDPEPDFSITEENAELEF